MANPFLVLGGIAVGIVVATMGVLQVPGWVKTAQDASAINDLSTAAIGEATAGSLGFGYMTGSELSANAGKLGVGLTLSNGVKICVTRNADTSSYAAVALSPSGAFFARVPGSTTAREGRNAEEALTAIGGLPEGVPSPVIDGDCVPGAELVGSGTGSDAGTGGGNVPPAALEDVTSLGRPAHIAYTSHGIYALNQTNGQLVRSGDDRHAHAVTLTGAVVDDAAALQYWHGLDSDAAGNLYAVGQTSGDNTYKAYRIAPDHTSTDITPQFQYTGTGYAHQMTIDELAVTPSGTAYYIGEGAASGSYGDEWDDPKVSYGLWKQVSGHRYELVLDLTNDELDLRGNNGDMTVDAAGNVIRLTPITGELIRIAPDGRTTRIASQQPDGEKFSGKGVEVTDDGSMIYVGGSNQLLRVTIDGTVTVAASQDFSGFGEGPPADAWVEPYDVALDPSGNVYFSDGGFPVVLRMTSSGSLEITMKD